MIYQLQAALQQTKTTVETQKKVSYVWDELVVLKFVSKVDESLTSCWKLSLNFMSTPET